MKATQNIKKSNKYELLKLLIIYVGILVIARVISSAAVTPITRNINSLTESSTPADTMGSNYLSAMVSLATILIIFLVLNYVKTPYQLRKQGKSPSRIIYTVLVAILVMASTFIVLSAINLHRLVYSSPSKFESARIVPESCVTRTKYNPRGGTKYYSSCDLMVSENMPNERIIAQYKFTDFKPADHIERLTGSFKIYTGDGDDRSNIMIYGIYEIIAQLSVIIASLIAISICVLNIIKLKTQNNHSSKIKTSF